MVKLYQVFSTVVLVVLVVCAGSVAFADGPLRHEAHGWWKPPAASKFREFRLRVDLPTEPVSGTVSLRVRFTIPAVSGVLEEPTLASIVARVASGPITTNNVNWTPTVDSRQTIVTMNLDTSGMPDGWHRIEISGIVDDGESRQRLVELSASFESSNGNAAGSGAPQGPHAVAILLDETVQLEGVVDTEFVSVVPYPLASLWQAGMRSHGDLSAGGTEHSGPSLFVSFDSGPNSRNHANVQVNEWPVPPDDFTLSLHPPDGPSWLYARSTLATASHSLGAVLVFGVESDVPPLDPPIDPDAPDPPPPPPPLVDGEWHVAAEGTGNGSPVAPFGLIQDGLDAAQAGDTIIIGPGTYGENLRTKRNGTEAQTITLTSADGLGSVEIVDPTATGDEVFEVVHAYHVVNGLIFNGNYAAKDAILIRSTADFLLFADNEVKRSKRDCIDIRSPEGVVIARSLVHHCLKSYEE